jgi:hypothetical protein
MPLSEIRGQQIENPKKGGARVKDMMGKEIRLKQLDDRVVSS